MYRDCSRAGHFFHRVLYEDNPAHHRTCRLQLSSRSKRSVKMHPAGLPLQQGQLQRIMLELSEAPTPRDRRQAMLLSLCFFLLQQSNCPYLRRESLVSMRLSISFLEPLSGAGSRPSLLLGSRARAHCQCRRACIMHVTRCALAPSSRAPRHGPPRTSLVRRQTRAANICKRLPTSPCASDRIMAMLCQLESRPS